MPLVHLSRRLSERSYLPFLNISAVLLAGSVLAARDAADGGGPPVAAPLGSVVHTDGLTRPHRDNKSTTRAQG